MPHQPKHANPSDPSIQDGADPLNPSRRPMDASQTIAESRRRPLISIVTPVYNEEDNVLDCCQAVRAVFERELPDCDFEHIFCDNASTDGTVARLRQLASHDRRVKVILNARNFGPFRSTYNGLLATQGDAVLVLLAADLQDPPELLPQFVGKWREGYQVVYGVKVKREEGLVIRLVRDLYYRTVSRFASITIPTNVSEFQFVDRVVIDALRQCDDYYPYIRGMIANCGFCVAGIPYTWKARRKGFSKNRLYHLIDQGLNGLISFTNIPMRFCMFLGLAVASFSVVYALFSLILNLLYYRQLAPSGIPTLIVSSFLFSGLQLFFFGVQGEYIAAIHFQVRKRPLVIERERINLVVQGPSRPVHVPAESRGAHFMDRTWRKDSPTSPHSGSSAAGR